MNKKVEVVLSKRMTKYILSPLHIIETKSYVHYMYLLSINEIIMNAYINNTCVCVLKSKQYHLDLKLYGPNLMQLTQDNIKFGEKK